MMGMVLRAGWLRRRRQTSRPSPPGTMMSSRKSAGGCRLASGTRLVGLPKTRTPKPEASRWCCTRREISVSSSSTNTVWLKQVFPSVCVRHCDVNGTLNCDYRLYQDGKENENVLLIRDPGYCRSKGSVRRK